MSNIIPFNYNSKQVRVIEKNGEPWFVAKDIAEILEYSNPAKMYARIEEDEKTTIPYREDGSNYQTNIVIINESGLYEAILGSEKPEAKEFKKWVKREVLPSIRKTGGYSIQRIDSYMISDPIERAKAWIKEQEEKLLLEAKVKELAPAAEFGNAVGNSKASILVRDYVKILAKDGIEIGQDEMFDWLNKKGYIYREKGQWKAYSDYTKMGVLHMIERPFSTAEHGDIIKYTVKITGKGQKYFYEKLKGTEYDKRAS